VRPFVVRRIGRLRIAFLGLTAPRSASYPQTRGLTIGDPVAAAKIWIPRARAQADIVIAVTHIGVDDDARLVRETRGLDAVVGGDSHTFLYQLKEEKNLDGAVVPIVQDGEFGVRLGRFELTFAGDARRGWRLARYADELIAVDAAVPPDRAVAALVDRYARALDRPAGTVPAVGATPAERTRLTAETLAGAWKSATGAEVGLQPEAALFESFRTPAVTRYQIHAIVPFHDTVWTGQITGARLKALLATPTAAGGVMHATIAPADIDPAKTYTAATTDFVAQVILANGTDTHEDARAALERMLTAAKP
jgi:2',3'-cyclic-nucleotide 2'-phosphodiesterase (5'-nucleotidase family)